MTAHRLACKASEGFGAFVGGAGRHGVVVGGSPEVGGENIHVEQRNAERQKEDQGAELRDHDDGVEERRRLDAMDDQKRHEPENHRREDDAGQRVSVDECWEEVAERRHHHGGECDVAQPSRKPVTPARNESGKRTEPLFGVFEDAVEVGSQLREVRDGERERGEAEADDDPGDDHAARARHLRQLSGKRERTGADARSDDHSDQGE